ncbi:TPA: tail fiber domain-containing protein [Klebsiella pneumoniae]|uniref:tail fiber domain-containing protein n=2 Tax=Klebsiella TaxID=570 RepID=UPI000C9B5896|nr:tail fiber domain-containing protein [Klebsiella pneumoniae]MCE0340780.1 tail fiber domain-containing protein [Klebsiella pneumoniae]MCE0346315.1 tail fiber domain-containing protein [Klebsiella pneumoniae]HEL6374704.1 tail fiber domain-containing protein [Klebsiella pneumoniae]
MYHLDNTSGVPEMPEPKEPQSITPRWFGESQDQGGISWPGADWFNTVQAELLNTLKAAGVTPDKSNQGQLSEAIKRIVFFDSTIDVLTSTINRDYFVSRGFYQPNDGGGHAWISTGVLRLDRAGKHIPSEAKVYNLNGLEFQIKIDAGSFVNPKVNGVRELVDFDESQVDTDDFVCLGEAINGLYFTLPILYQAENTLSSSTTFKALNITLPDGLYRIGKEAIKLRSNIRYDFGKSTIYVKASRSRKYSVTGTYLNGLEHAVEDIDSIYAACGENLYWESVSLGFTTIRGGAIIGDHVPGTLDADCTAGIGILALNPWYCSFSDIRIENFRVNLVGMQCRTDEDGVLPSSIIPYKSSLLPEKIGNFYSCVFKNLYVSTARYCCVRLHIDWCQWIGGTISNNGRWASSPSGQQCDYFLIETGHGFHCSGAYLSIPAYNPTERKPNKSVIATAARGSVYSACYMESTPSYVTILNKWWNDGNEKGFGLNIDCIGSQYRPDRTYKYLTFEAGAFGYYDANENWVPPAGYGSYPSTNGIDFVRFGSPTHDTGAFPHGGFDFKYGTYGVMYGTNSTYVNPPDVDSLRGHKTTKEMFSPYGLMAANGILQLPVLSPAIHSNICIWYKDMSGNFDLNNIVLWQTANIDQLATDAGYNYNLFIAKAEMAIDFGNGYKMAIIQNLKWNNNDGVGTSGAQQSLQLTIPDATPVILKAVQAFTGGIPVFPTGLNYIPESSDQSIWGNVQPTNGFRYNLFKKVGGGIFAPGDLINPWIAHQRANPDYKFGTTFYEDYGYSNLPLLVKGGNAIGSYFAKDFTVSVVSVDAANGRTTIDVPAAYKPFVFMGVPLNITAGSSTGYTGETRIHGRKFKVDGSLSGQYVLDAVVGATGDELTINQRTLTPRTYYRDYTADALTANGSFTLRGTVMRFGYNAGATGTRAVEFYVGGATTKSADITAYGTSIGLNASALVFGGNIGFSATNTWDIGSAGNTVKNIYSQNAVTVVSDRDHKPVREAIPDNILDIWGTIAIKRFKYDWAIAEKGEDGARWHVGYIAQDIVEAFAAAGEDATEWALVVHNEWDAQPEQVESWDDEYETIPAQYDEQGVKISEETQVLIRQAGSRVTKEAIPAGSEWRLVMDECNAMENAYQRRRLDRIEGAAG